jgi:hypothetical protein
MGCCGRQTTPMMAPVNAGSLRQGPRSAGSGRSQAIARTYAYFEYVGRSAMTVTGGVTGRRYRFERPGARVAVDPTDRPSLSKVPHLKLAGGP